MKMPSKSVVTVNTLLKLTFLSFHFLVKAQKQKRQISLTDTQTLLQKLTVIVTRNLSFCIITTKEIYFHLKTNIELGTHYTMYSGTGCVIQT